MALRQGLQRALLLRSAAARRPAARAFSVAPHAADKFVVDFPEEHEGLNIEFNWSLADDDVTPHGDAFRNLPFAKLQALAAADKAKPASGKPAKVQEVDVDVSIGAFEPVYERVTTHLSTLPSLFAQDGAVGSFKDDRSRVRVIADAPQAALFAQSLLVRVPTKDPHAARPIVAYVASTGAFAGQPPAAYLLLDKDDDGALFAKVLVTGAASLATLQDAIGLAKKKLLAQQESASLVLPADALAKDGKTALVFGASPAARANALNSGLLYGAHLTIWNAAGLTSLFGGAVADAKAVAGSKQLVPVDAAAAAVHVPCHNLVDAPKAAIFVDAKAGGVKAISPADAAKRLAAADADADADKFAQLLEAAKTKSFVVGSDADIASAFAKV